MKIPIQTIDSQTTREQLVLAFSERDRELYRSFGRTLDYLANVVLNTDREYSARIFPVNTGNGVSVLISAVFEGDDGERLCLATEGQIQEAFGDETDGFINFCSEYELPEYNPTSN